MTDRPTTTLHNLRYNWPETAPDLSRLPVTIDTGIRLGLVRLIELGETRVCVSRRILSDWEEPYSSFRHLNCKKITTDDGTINSASSLHLVHPHWWKTIMLYEFLDPRFDVSEFARELSEKLRLPLYHSDKFMKAYW